MNVSVFVCSNPHCDGVQKSNWCMLHAITWCERAYDPYLVKSSRSGADHSVAIRLQTAELGHHHRDRQFMDFFHERQSPICPIHKLCGIPQLRIVSKLHARRLYAGHLSTLCAKLTATAQLTVLGKVIATHCDGSL